MPDSSQETLCLLEHDIVIEFPTIDEIAIAWPVIAPILKRATDRGKAYQPIDILHGVMMGRMSLILVREAGRRDGAHIDYPIVAVAVTEVRQLPRCRVLDVTFCAGAGVKRWIEQLLEVIDAQAETAGCSDTMVYGRKGWIKFGFELEGFILRRRAGVQR